MSTVSLRERLLGGLWSSLVGDALGVPVEFRSREEVQRNSVRGMRGYGTHNQPPGTWSDDSSLLLCSAESLLERDGFDAADMGARFVRWEADGHWTPHGRVFDIGIATSQALSRLRNGSVPELAGGADEYSNGNGSLMRILPVALWFSSASTEVLLDNVHRASALTHRHRRSQMACGFFALVVRELLRGVPAADAYEKAAAEFASSYGSEPFMAERLHFQQLEAGKLLALPEKEIGSSGYVMHTLTASLWCLLTSSSFEETVLKAVNLGGDTDTTGCVAGGLAGVAYGESAIPSEWIDALARKGEVLTLFEGFAGAAGVVAPASSARTCTLYRPVGPAELKLIAESGYRAFPPRLPEQPIFYPVLNEEYARQIARDWNVGDSGAGYVTRFEVAADFLRAYEPQTVGGAVHQELWIPAEALPALNRNIMGRIEVIAKFHRDEPPI